MMPTSQSFVIVDLSDGLPFFVGKVPDHLLWNAAAFEAAWHLRPEIRPSIQLVGRPVQVPRWHAAYGEDYRFSGQVSRAQPIPDLFLPILEWSQKGIHPAHNGLLVNWYEGPEHYIGPHNDSTKNMVPGAPIVTVSFGEDRKFRLTRGKQAERIVRDFRMPNGTVFILPQETNAVWKHSVPKSVRYAGRRISVTIRAFEAWKTE